MKSYSVTIQFNETGYSEVLFCAVNGGSNILL